MNWQLVRTSRFAIALTLCVAWTTLSPVASAQGPEGSWAPAAPLGFDLSGSPLSLPNGKVFVRGEGRKIVRGEGGVLGREGGKTAVFDPASNRWEVATAALPKHAEGEASAVLADGRVMLLSQQRELTLFEVSKNRVSRGPSAPGQHVAETSATSVTLTPLPTGPKSVCGTNCGKVLLSGGCNGKKAISTLYDPAKNSWSSPVPLIEKERCGHTATVLTDGRVLIAGGQNGDNLDLYETAEIFDPKTNSLSPTGSMKYDRRFPAAVRLADGKVLVVGASQDKDCQHCLPTNVLSRDKAAEVYDPATGAWSETGDTKETLPPPEYTLTLLGNGKVLLVAGFLPVGTAAEVYDPASAKWTYTAPMAAPPELPSLFNLDKTPCGDNCGKVLAINGVDSSTQLYTPAGPLTAVDPVHYSYKAAQPEGGDDGLLASNRPLILGAGAAIVVALALGFLLRRRH